MSDDGNCWDPYCCCRVTRKNIVMTFMAIACFALVTWTIVVTGRVKDEDVIDYADEETDGDSAVFEDE